MSAADTDSELVFQVLNEIGIISQLSGAQLGRALTPFNLGVSEFHVLNHFVRVGDGTTPSRLARIFQVTKPSMTAILAKLQAKKLVEITPSQTDRRRKIVSITDAGRQARTDSLMAIAPLGQQLLDEFDLEQLRTIRPILTRLREFLDAARNQEDGLNQ